MFIRSGFSIQMFKISFAIFLEFFGFIALFPEYEITTDVEYKPALSSFDTLKQAITRHICKQMIVTSNIKPCVLFMIFFYLMPRIFH